MDPYARIALVCFSGALGHALIAAWWDGFKAREATKPIPMKFKNGVYVPWGRVQRLQTYGWRIVYCWFAYMAFWLVALAAFKLGLWGDF